MQKRYFAFRAYGAPGHPFPKFWDNYPTLTLARKDAAQALKAGWRFCEILKDSPKKKMVILGCKEKL